jgi:hypothetical protein
MFRVTGMPVLKCMHTHARARAHARTHAHTHTHTHTHKNTHLLSPPKPAIFMHIMKPQMVPPTIIPTGFTFPLPPLSAAAVEFPGIVGIAK